MLALAAALPLACGSDDDDKEALQDLGKPCTYQGTECQEHDVNLICSSNQSNARLQSQCALGCTDDSRCDQYFGSAAYCLAVEKLCVKKCTSNNDCPSGSECTEDKQGNFCLRIRD